MIHAQIVKRMLVLLLALSTFATARPLDGAAANSTATLYYSSSCSHCQQVLNYLEGKKLKVAKKNISDPSAKKEMRSLGHYQVPVLVDGTKSYVGASQIINHLKGVQ